MSDLDDAQDFSTQEALVLEQLEAEEEKARTFEDWLALGMNAFAQEAYEQAVSYFDAAIEQEGEDARAYLYRAEAHQECGNYDEALDDYELAVFYGHAHAAQLRDELKELMKEPKRKKTK